MVFHLSFSPNISSLHPHASNCGHFDDFHRTERIGDGPADPPRRTHGVHAHVAGRQVQGRDLGEVHHCCLASKERSKRNAQNWIIGFLASPFCLFCWRGVLVQNNGLDTKVWCVGVAGWSFLVVVQFNKHRFYNQQFDKGNQWSRRTSTTWMQSIPAQLCKCEWCEASLSFFPASGAFQPWKV